MGEEPAKAEPARYRAFISYSHGDARFAHWLHRKLESWRLPDKSRLTPVFIDHAELAAGSDLSAQVREALEQSAALVVVCSPNARASRWVGQEIELFRALHPDRPVLAALIEGEPDEAFPAPLLGTGDAPLEPLAADFRKGHDGQRLGLLKLAAGLTALPLDRLVQRDAAARQRRVMAVTAGALALVLVLSAALFIALRARAEAERQRAEAEGLVEFMLTDLRDKLKGVGRLEIMGAVNERVMTHYAGQQDLSNTPSEILLRRAKLLHAMAEDDLSETGSKSNGRLDAIEADRITTILVERDPKNLNFIHAHGLSKFWLGQSAFVSASVSRRRDDAMPYWRDYQTLTNSLVQAQPLATKWIVEASYAEGNLCALQLSEPALPALAIPHCDNASKALEKAYRMKPGDIEIGLNYAMSLAWLADAQVANKDLDAAMQSRRQQLEVAAELRQRFPKDLRAQESLMLAEFGLAKLMITRKEIPLATTHIDRAEFLSKQLIIHDPKNSDWTHRFNQILKLRSELQSRN